jgi:hypothetical protein
LKSNFTAILGQIIARLSGLCENTEMIDTNNAWGVFPRIDSSVQVELLDNKSQVKS